MRILFVTWDGPQVSYLQSLFLPIFRELRPAGYRVDVLQFGWGDPQHFDAIAQTCRDSGVGYRPVQVWRKLGGAGALVSAVRGGGLIRRAMADFGSDLLMARSILPALAAQIARRSGQKVPFLFDADGLAADERVDFAGLSRTSATYRILRSIEARAAREACAVLVRSQAGADTLRARAGLEIEDGKFFKVLNGRDPLSFHPGDARSRAETRAKLGLAGDAPLLVYAGSVGPQYRMGEVAALFAAVRQKRKDAHLLVLSGSPSDAAAVLAGDPAIAGDMTILRAEPGAVAAYVAAADLGLAYRAATFSMRAVAPIKLSEYLLCGLPIVGTAAVGDTVPAVEAGLFVDEGAGPEASAQWFVERVLPDREAIRTRAREVGLRHFSLGQSVASYLAALEYCSPRARYRPA